MKMIFKTKFFIGFLTLISIFAFSSCQSAKSDKISKADATYKMEGLQKGASIEFNTSESYERNGVWFVDMAEIVPFDANQFKNQNEVHKGDIFLDTSNKFVMFLGDETYTIMKGTKLGNIENTEEFKNLLSQKDKIVKFED